MARMIDITELKPGMVILGVIEQNGPVKIRKSGLVTSIEMVQGLAEMGVLKLNIDPDQTVELEGHEPVSMSQTQFVLNANAEKPKLDADSHLSEQFNRSLFLPSLQRVPSAWQYYSGKTLVAAAVIVGGFAIGWLGGTYPSWLPNQPVAVIDESSQVTELVSNLEETTPKLDGDAEQPIITPSAEENNLAVDQDIIDEQDAELDTNIIEEEPLTLGYVPEQTASSDESPRIENNGDISPELLERFEQAMADLERESAVDSPREEGEPDPVSYSRVENVLRVDQLPARVMARLPSLSFSAHMYASNPRERWVKVNDMEVNEGDWITDDLLIERIEPQHVIMVFQGHQFSMRALSDW